MAQIFDSVQTQSTANFSKLLQTILPSEHHVAVTRPSTGRDISCNKPVLVMCQNYSRIATDIKTATQDLQVSGIPSELVAVIIIHAKAAHALPKQMTADTIEDEECMKFGLLVDFGFIDGTLHKCEMNSRGHLKLKQFLDKHAKKTVRQSSFSGSQSVVKSIKGAQQGGDTQPFCIIDAIPKSWPVQIYIQPEITEEYLVQNPLKIPKEFQVVQSVVDLSEKNLWIVVCDRKNSVQDYIVRDKSPNPKVLALLNRSSREIKAEEDANNNLLRIEGAFYDAELELVKEMVRSFVGRFIFKGLSQIFEQNNVDSCQIEAYIKDDFIKLEEFLGYIPHRPVASLMDFTKQDPRVLWLIVCNDDSLIEMFEKADPANAKVIFVFGDNESEETRNTLLILRLCRRSASSQAVQIRQKIIDFMTNIQMKLLVEPLDGLFQYEPSVATNMTVCPVAKKEKSCSIL